MRGRLFVSARENFLLPSLWMKCVIFPVKASELYKVVELFLEHEFAVLADVVSGTVSSYILGSFYFFDPRE